jgi:hypothetical protein
MAMNETVNTVKLGIHDKINNTLIFNVCTESRCLKYMLSTESATARQGDENE